MKVKLDIGVKGKVLGIFSYKGDIIPRALKTMDETVADTIVAELAKAGITDGIGGEGGVVFIQKRPA